MMKGSAHLLALGGRRRLPYVQQSEASECGLACIAMIASFHGYRIDLGSLRRRFNVSLKGATLKDLVEICGAIGFNSRPIRAEMDYLNSLQLPAILHWDLNHFIVLERISQRFGRAFYHIHDPARGQLILNAIQFSKSWTGVALELTKSESFRPKIDLTRLRISQLWTSTDGFWRAFSNVLLLSLILQLIVLTAPFYLQIAIDTVLPAADVDLLFMLAIGFGGLALIDLMAGWLRSLVLVQINSALSYQIVVNLFRHLVRLPLPWFEKRHVGDVISRFGSTRPITQLLSEGAIAAVIDGLMAILTLALMFVYSIVLGIIAVTALLLYVAVRFGFLHALRLSNVNVITTAAKENSIFIESVRGIGSIKAFGQESNRQRIWQQSKADAINAEIKLGRLSAGFNAVGKFIVALERVIFVYVAISQAFEGRLTVGMIFAFQAYKQQFVDASMRLVEQAINLQILQVHLGRISDIALSRQETSDDVPINESLDFTKPLVLESVAYRYGSNEAPIFVNLSLTVEPGEKVALIGPSGGGKTTLLKIMASVFEPSAGFVRLGNQTINPANRTAFRRSVGTVAQGDTLYAGGLAENIAFFDPEIDMDRVREVCRIAEIADEIESMPMGYETLVGDMGSVLSGGQMQRVLLARALYPGPKILFMDEGTANLDPQNEAKLLTALGQLETTMILVAHRPQTLSMADRVLMMRDGALAPVPRFKQAAERAGGSAERPQFIYDTTDFRAI